MSLAERLTPYLGVTAFAGAVTLWTLGIFRTPPPGFLSSLLAAIVAAGIAVLLAAGWQGSPLTNRPLLVTFGGVLPPFSVVLFLTTTLFVSQEPRTVHRLAAPEATAERLRIVSFNVLHDYPRFSDQQTRTSRLAAALRSLEPDVVLLQEAWSTPVHGDLVTQLAAELDMDSSYVRANGSRRLIGFEEGPAALSRWPIVEARVHRLAPRRPALERRVALSLAVRTAPAETLQLIVAHLTHADPEARDAQAHFLLELLPADWHLVAGDFNATTDSAALRAFFARGYRTLVPGGIDHVLVPDHDSAPWLVRQATWTLRPQDLRRLTGEAATLSDHPGIVVDLVRRHDE